MKKPLITALIITALALTAAIVFSGVQYQKNTAQGVESDAVATSASENITVSAPRARATIGNSVTISGSARVFENTLNYRILDGNGTVLAEGNTIASAPDIGQFGAFSVTPAWNTPKTITGTIEVFDYSAKDGSVIDLVTIPVSFVR